MFCFRHSRFAVMMEYQRRDVGMTKPSMVKIVGLTQEIIQC